MGPLPPCCSPRTTEPPDPAEPWGLAITPPGLPRLAHRARADASRSTVFCDPCAALASPGRSGGVVRHPCHGSPSLPRSARPQVNRAPVSDPSGFRPSAGHSWPDVDPKNRTSLYESFPIGQTWPEEPHETQTPQPRADHPQAANEGTCCAVRRTVRCDRAVVVLQDRFRVSQRRACRLAGQNPPLPEKLTPLHPDHSNHQGA